MSATLELDTVVAAAPDQISTEVGEEAVILGLAQGRYYGLNPVGLFIWRLLATPRPVRAICAEVVAAYEVSPQQAESDVLGLVSRLAEADLIRFPGS